MRKALTALFNNDKILYTGIFIFHVLLICIVFHEHIVHPSGTMLFDRWDGLKNNFTLVSYVKENMDSAGIYKYQAFNYPFGDYVYSTDNTPLFSITFRWFCIHIYDLSDYTLPIFNYCILANILVCGLLVFHVFKKLLHNHVIAWLLALFLPWTNIQVMRFFAGHFNLSLSSLMLVAIALFMAWYRHKDNIRKQMVYGLLMCLFCFFSFLIHGYYLAILPAFLSAMLFFSGIFKIRSAAGKRSVAAALLVPVICAAMSIGFIKTTDGYFNIRQDFANGYDSMKQKTIISSLYTRNGFHKIAFPLRSANEPDEIEKLVYLGNTGLYALAFIFLICFFNRRFRLLVFRIQQDFFRNPLTAGIFVGGLMMLSISLGEWYFHVMTPAKFISPVNHTGNWSAGEIVFSLLMSGLCIYTFIRAILIRNPQNELQRPVESRRSVFLKSAGFYGLSVVVLYLLFGGYTIRHGLIINVTNPLWYLHKLTLKVEQFRSLSRFVWPFYWTFYLWIMYTVAGIYRATNRYAKGFILTFIIFLGVMETVDYAGEMEQALNRPTIFAESEIKKIRQSGIDFRRYQAILPIPYNQAGSENYNYTINDAAPWDGYVYNLNLASGLPLMNAKISRTPPAFARSLIHFIACNTADPALAKALNTRPILVAVNQELVKDSTFWAIPDKELFPMTYEWYWEINKLPERNHLVPVDSLGHVYFYEWQPVLK